MALNHLGRQHPWNQFRDDLDRLITGFFGQTPETSARGVRPNQPPLSVWEQGDSVMVELEVPGVKPDQVAVSVAGDELSIKVQRSGLEQDGLTYHRRERPVGEFVRSIRVPAEIDSDRVAAALHDGVLTVTLPKAPSAKPRKIAVNASN